MTITTVLTKIKGSLLTISLLSIIMMFFLPSTSLSLQQEDYIPGAKGAILMDASSGRVLYDHNANTKLPMASTTKIMTAILAIESGRLDEEVKVSNKSAITEGSSVYLRPNQKIKLECLVYGLMLRSGNDCAVAIAEHLAGSVEKFAEQMNDKAKEIGAVNSNFENPHGLHSKNHYTTAYDLALITRYGLSMPKFKEIFSAKSKVIPWEQDEQRKLLNKNKTLWEYNGGDGGKTGFTKAAGRCLVTTSTRNDFQVIAVVLDCPDWFNTCYRLMDYGYDTYRKVNILNEQQYVKDIFIKNGVSDTLTLVSRDTLTLPVKEEEVGKINYTYNIMDNIEAPIAQGQKIGTLEISLDDGKLLESVDLISKYEVKKKKFRHYIVDNIIKWIDKGL
jgi:serine-type D-Ala-D-Ala carboxypeptidase (penicillin-binding protein 5/6)